MNVPKRSTAEYFRHHEDTSQGPSQIEASDGEIAATSLLLCRMENHANVDSAANELLTERLGCPTSMAALRRMTADSRDHCLGDHGSLYRAALLLSTGAPPSPRSAAAETTLLRNSPGDLRHHPGNSSSYEAPPTADFDDEVWFPVDSPAARDEASLRGHQEFERPVLCSNGSFYEADVASGSELEERGLIDCSTFPSLTSTNWNLIRDHVCDSLDDIPNHLQASVAVAWLFVEPDERDHFLFWCRNIVAEDVAPDGDAVLHQWAQKHTIQCLSLIHADFWKHFIDTTRQALVHQYIDADGIASEEQLRTSFQFLRQSPLSEACMQQPERCHLWLGIALYLSRRDVDENSQDAHVAALTDMFCNTSCTDCRDVLALSRHVEGMNDSELFRMAGAVTLLTSRNTDGISLRIPEIAYALSLLAPDARHSFAGHLSHLFEDTLAPAELLDLVSILADQTHVEIEDVLSRASACAQNLSSITPIFFRTVLAAFVATDPDMWDDTEATWHLVVPHPLQSCRAALGVLEALGQLSDEERALLRSERGHLFDVLENLGPTANDQLWQLNDVNWLREFCANAQTDTAPMDAPVREVATIGTETVMDAARMQTLVRDLERLSALMPSIKYDANQDEAAIEEISCFLRSSQADDLQQRIRGGSNERQNAIRALGIIHTNRECETTHLNMFRASAMVWRLIEQHGFDAQAGDTGSTSDQGLLRLSLASRLAECIEDLGSMVCFWGQGQRICSVLYGYGYAFPGETQLLLPTARELLGTLAQEINAGLTRRGLDAPSAEDRPGIMEWARGRGSEIFVHDEEKLSTFNEEMSVYFDSCWPEDDSDEE